MAMITLVDYGKIHNLEQSTCRRGALNGRFKTAVKIGRDWFIDENEPLIDKRVKTGKYIGWRKKSKDKPE